MTDIEFVVWFAGAVVGGWAPLEGGQWQGDDEWAEFLPLAPPMSELLGDLAGTASAMHESVLALAFTAPEKRPSDVLLPAMALARSAIECLATGLWLCLSKEANERRKRYLTLGYQDINDLTGFGGGPRSHSSREDVELLAQMGVDAQTHIYTSRIIKAVDSTLGADTFRTWQLYSGVAHGRPWALRAIRRTIPEPQSNNESVGQTIGVLTAPILLARSFLTVVDLRRRFPGTTSLELERLEQIRRVW